MPKNPKQNNDHNPGAGHGTITRRNQRRAETKKRNAERSTRTAEEQLAILNHGGFKATKERAKLSLEIQRVKNPHK